MQMASLGGGSKRIKDAEVPDGRLVGSYLCAWHRSWTDYGHSECMVRRSAASAKWGCHRLVCANVYGLCWSESLLAKMECAVPFSPLLSQSRKTFSESEFRERRVQPLRHLPSPADRARNHNLHILAKLQLHRPTREADMVYSSRARPTPCAPTYSRLFVKIILCIQHHKSP